MIGALVWIKRNDNIGFRLAWFSLNASGWGFFSALWISQNYELSSNLKLVRVAHVFAIFIPITWLHFVFNFIGKKEPFKYFYLSQYLIPIFLLFFINSPYFISGMHPILHLRYFTSPGPLYHIFTLIFGVLVVYSFFYLAKSFMDSKGQEREQRKFLLLSTAIAFIGGTTFLPVYHIEFPMQIIALMPLYPFFMGVALMQGLFDAHRIADAFQREKLAALGTMAASLNHEIRNPLFIARSKIETYFDSVERGIYQPGADKQTVSDSTHKDVLTQLLRALDIMQKFSDFARPFKKKEDNQTILIREAVEDALKFVSNEFAVHKIQLNRSNLDGVTIKANRRQFEEILFNVMLNACHAMGDKGGALEISTKQTGKKVGIEIRDTGPGMSEDQLRRIFEPFYTTKEDMGTGLGLYITKQLVERNNGRISVNSKLGQGTSFLIQFEAAANN